MTTRIQNKWNELRRANDKALIAFVMAGDPDMKRSLDTVLAMAGAGADIIELGVPFSEPVADGEVIQRAGARALGAGAYLPSILDLIRDIRRHSEVPLLLMSYLNPILRYGFARFAADAVAAGADGALVTDLSVEEAEPYLAEMHKHDLDTVFLASPTSTASRLARVAKYSSGFVYAVSRTGTTGAQANLSTTIVPLLENLRRITKTPIAAGFGISKPEHLSALAPYADGVVVGSALVRCVEANLHNPAPAAAEFVRALRTGFPVGGK